MTDQPPSAAELRRECLNLIEQLYRHRLNIKLLRAARSMLQATAEYKAKRRDRFVRPP